VWQTTQTLSDVYLEMERFDEAVDLLTNDSRMSCEDVWSKILNVNEASLAVAFWNQGKSGEAAELLNKLFPKCMRFLLQEEQGIGELKHVLFICDRFRGLGRWHEAAELLQGIMKTIAAVGNEDAFTAEVVERLCAAYDALDKLDLAIELREASLLTIKKVFGETSHQTEHVTRALLRNYQVTNRLSEAAALESELARIKDLPTPELHEPNSVTEIFERLTKKYPLQKPPATTHIGTPEEPQGLSHSPRLLGEYYLRPRTGSSL